MELNLKTQQNKLISLFRVSLMFFLFFFVQQTVASSQSITLPSHNITIKDAFSEIEKQTGMSVDYDESVINLNKQVNASVNNKSLNETLALMHIRHPEQSHHHLCPNGSTATEASDDFRYGK